MKNDTTAWKVGILNLHSFLCKFYEKYNGETKSFEIMLLSGNKQLNQPLIFFIKIIFLNISYSYFHAILVDFGYQLFWP